MRAANLGLRFLLELSPLAALAYWGYHASGSGLGRIALAAAAPLVAAAVWGLFVAPHVGGDSRLCRLWRSRSDRHGMLTRESPALVGGDSRLCRLWRSRSDRHGMLTRESPERE